MAVVVRFDDWHDVSHICSCLLAVADTRGPGGELLAGRLVRISEQLADALDAANVGAPPAPRSPDRPSITYSAASRAFDAAGYNLVDDRALGVVPS